MIVRFLLIALSGAIIASRSLAGPGLCDGNPDFCPSFENQCPKAKDGAIHFVSPFSGSTYDGYCRDGLPDGAVSIHHKNSKPYAIGEYENGKQEGLWRYHNPEGNPTGEALFAAGRIIDNFNPRTKERQLWIYEDGKLVATELHRDGTPLQRLTYEKGEGATTVVESEYLNGWWIKKSEKKVRHINKREGAAVTCDIC